jgi:phage N-6-adenine-methyltransferase
MDKVMFSSKDSKWETPQDLFDLLDGIFDFDIDVCASADNAKCSNYITEKSDSLTMDWVDDDSDDTICWMNPPYGRGIGPWVEKAYRETTSTGTVVCLVPSRTDTKWFQHMWEADALIFIKGRLKFGSAENCAPFPSVIGIFGWRLSKAEVEKLETIGRVIFP